MIHCGSDGKESACNVGDLGWEDPWRRERLPTPVFWPGEFHGPYSPWGCKESDTTEQLSLSRKRLISACCQEEIKPRMWLAKPIVRPQKP